MARCYSYVAPKTNKYYLNIYEAIYTITFYLLKQKEVKEYILDKPFILYMKKVINSLFILFLVACQTGRMPGSRYTEEEIAVLQLDETQIVTPETSQTKHLNLNPFLGEEKKFDFGSVLKTVRLVPLETTNKSLLDDRIYKIITTDEYIYIMDRYKEGSIVMFTKDGKFVKRFSHGQGPGELQRLYDIDYDFQKNELVAYQHSFFLFFDKQGNYLRQEKLPVGFYNLAVTPKGYVLKALTGQTDIQMGDKQKYRLLFTTKNFKLNSAALPEHKKIKAFSTFTYLHKVGDLIKITSQISDTIYQYNYKNNKLSAEFVLDYDKKLPRKYIYSDTFDLFEKAIYNNDYYYCMGDYLETYNQNAFFVRNEFKDYEGIVYRDKKTGNMIGGNSSISTKEKSFAFIAFPIATFGDEFISFFKPHSDNYETLKDNILLSKADKEKTKHFKDDDNPVLVYFTLKEF